MYRKKSLSRGFHKNNDQIPTADVKRSDFLAKNELKASQVKPETPSAAIDKSGPTPADC
jgi:hypothetical protein